MAVQPSLDRLGSQLLKAGLQKDNPPLYQVIDQLIKATKQLQEATVEQISSITSGDTTATYLTHTTEAALPNSRRLIAGTNIAFADTTVQKTISVTGIVDRAFLTHTTEPTLTGSKTLVAGTNITFVDDTTSRTIIAGGASFPSGLDYITHSDESVDLPSSRQLLAGTGVSFDDTIANRRTINLDPSGLDSKGAQVYRSTNLTVADAVPTVVEFTTELLDEDNYWDIASPSRITIPRDGWYIIVGQATTGAIGAGAFNASIKVNGTTIRNGQTTFSSAATADGLQKVSVTALIKLVAGDYVELFVEINTSAATEDVLGGQNNTFIQIIKSAASVGSENTEWSVLTNGDGVNPELIFTSNGDVIMTSVG